VNVVKLLCVAGPEIILTFWNQIHSRIY